MLAKTPVVPYFFATKASFRGGELVGLSVTKHGAVHVLHMSGSLKTGPGLDEFNSEFDKLVTAGYSRFVLSMADVPHLDSNGIGALVRVYSTARNRGGGMRLVKPPSTVIDLLKTICVWPLFETSDSDEAAINVLGNKLAAKV